MANLSLDQNQKSRRRRAGPIIIGALFFLAACGVSLDFLAGQFGSKRLDDVSVTAPQSTMNAPSRPAASSVVARPTGDALSGQRVAVGQSDPFIDDMAVVGPESPLGRSDSTLPSSNAWPDENHHARKKLAIKNSNDPADESFEMARGQVRAPAEFDFDSQPEDLKISTDPSKWKGVPQLLPSPMYVSQLFEKRALDIRGGGWVIIDVNKSQITNVELFKSKTKSADERRVIEAKYADGSTVVNPSSAGFAIARGIPGLQPGGFEVFENPPCLVRFSNASEEEVCDVTVRGNKARFKFSPPLAPAEGPVPDFSFTDVSFDIGRGNWKKIATFNESFHPIGDPNRDGYPDFLVESVTGDDESGEHVLLMSHVHDDLVDYVSYSARFKGH